MTAWFQPSDLARPLAAHQLQALHRALEDLSPTQVAWVSGYLAGLGGVGAPAAQAPRTVPPVSILFGSQTGNAQGVAERLGEQARGASIDAQVSSMGSYAPRALAKAHCVLIVVSTHGDGEPPESAYALHRFLHGERVPRLERLHYAVLGLGDSSYAHFCQTAVDFDRRLAELGARRLLALRCCDLAYEADAADWSAAALQAASELAPPGTAGTPPGTVAGLPGVRPLQTSRSGRDAPFQATLLENRRITTADALADVRHLVLGVESGAPAFAPGDALGVWPHNDPALADAVLAVVGLDGDTPVTVGDAELGLRQALIERLELTRLHPDTVRAWAELAGDESLRTLVADGERLRAFAAERQLIDLLAGHPARPGAAALAAVLRPLQPRLYSIASSRAAFDDEVHLTVSVVGYRAHGRDHLGAASGYLAERVGPDAPLQVHVAPNQAFRLPVDGDTPIVMIGAGTGVAPYRAFLQHRAASGDRGRNWLVLGNRHFHRDFLYQLDWQAQRDAGLLHRVSLAFSRDGAGKVYVQQRLREEAAELYRWLQDGAHLYVCGAHAMGEAVHQALLDGVETQGARTREAAAAYLENLRLQARYHRDLY